MSNLLFNIYVYTYLYYMYNIIYTIIILNNLETSNSLVLKEPDVDNIIPTKLPASEANLYSNAA